MKSAVKWIARDFMQVDRKLVRTSYRIPSTRVITMGIVFIELFFFFIFIFLLCGSEKIAWVNMSRGTRCYDIATLFLVPKSNPPPLRRRAGSIFYWRRTRRKIRARHVVWLPRFSRARTPYTRTSTYTNGRRRRGGALRTRAHNGDP